MQLSATARGASLSAVPGYCRPCYHHLTTTRYVAPRPSPFNPYPTQHNQIFHIRITTYQLHRVAYS